MSKKRKFKITYSAMLTIKGWVEYKGFDTFNKFRSKKGAYVKQVSEDTFLISYKWQREKEKEQCVYPGFKVVKGEVTMNK